MIQLGAALLALVGCVLSWWASRSDAELPPVLEGEPTVATVIYYPPLILLAQNDVGYKNLSFLNSKGYLEGFYYNPRIDKQLLRDHSEGLIGMSACLGGEIAQTLEKILDEPARVGTRLDDAVDLTEHGRGIARREGFDDAVEQLVVGETEQARSARVREALGP